MKILVLMLSLALISCAQKEKSDTKQGETKSTKTTSTTKKTSTPGSLALAQCKKASDERVIEILEVEKGCELVYTKFGKPENIASSANGRAHCQTVFDRIKGRLLDAGYSCN